MNGFDKVHFKGTFRDYQQRVLNNTGKYLKDGRINIVAAPGSGKTILGLELIRRIGSPCIILSPTTAIRQQWGERFMSMFLDDKESFDDYFSSDLHEIKLLNSVTYQALYTAIEKVPADDGDDTDCSDIDIFKTMKRSGIKTVCLDEAHHLKNEWQRALERFISQLSRDVKIISLTATPPYDSEGSEWTRYINVCGEIDEEIFVPELVGQNSLCPHQDYVYFNYPTQEESERFAEHKKNALLAVDELGRLKLFAKVSKELNALRDYDRLFSSVKEYIALAVLLEHYGFKADSYLVGELTAYRGLPRFNMTYAQTALQFLLDGDLISEAEKSEILDILKRYSVYEKRKVTLELNDKLKRALISSVGKLKSISMIAKSEHKALGSRLRMLVLTDYIKKENLAGAAQETTFTSVNVVSIFETLRKALPGVNIGVLSGTLVILPKSAALSDVKHKKADIPGTDYCTVEFSGSTQRSVDCVGRMFERGELQILVGTKSLLGEGWDSPCINSLILASFVGSFVLSNQMRGRAIRIDKNDPGKSANIWHLVTVEPEYLFKDKASERISAYVKQDSSKLVSYDYDILKRRFDSFMGPNYTTGVIESGIERITAIKPPYDEEGIERINAQMLKLSARQEDVKAKWQGEVSGGRFSVAVETEVPKPERVPVFTFWNVAVNAAIAAAALMLIISVLIQILRRNVPLTLLFLAILGVLIALLFLCSRKLVLHINPANSIKTLGTAVYKTLCECGMISPSARVETVTDKGLWQVSIYLRNATQHDQNIFNTAMTEMLSPIDNPRYILVGKTRLGGLNYGLSFACPSIIGRKKEYVEVLVKKLKGSTGDFLPMYTRLENGRELILRCRKNSYITLNEQMINRKYKVTHWN